MHPIAILQIAIIVTGVSVLLCGMGLYWGSRFKHSTTAVVMNFLFVVIVWLVGPVLILLIFGIFGSNPFDLYLDGHPLAQATAVISATVPPSYLDYYWEEFGELDAMASTLWLVACMLARCSIGFLFAWRAKSRFRRSVF